MLWGWSAGGCKCRAANRLYVLSLTPERGSKGKCCLDTLWEFLPPDRSVSLKGDHALLREVQLVVLWWVPFLLVTFQQLPLCVLSDTFTP